MDISYNGVAFSLVKTNRLEFTPEYSQDGTSLLWIRCEIDIEAVINPQTMAYLFGNPPTATPGTLPPSTVVAIRQALETPRRSLVISSATGIVGTSVNVIEAPASGLTRDLNNGPIPGPLVIRDLQGARTWFVRWRCTTWITDCCSPYPNDSCGDQLSPLVSNRYAMSDLVDEQWKSSRVTRGSAVFRADLLENVNKTADSFRALVLPIVPLGFQRRRISVTVRPNANILDYECLDQERLYDIGDSASSGSFITDVDARFITSSILTGDGIPGGQSISQAVIHIKGDKRASNWIMTQRAFAIAAGKIPLGGTRPDGKPAGFVRQISIAQTATDREITLNIAFMNTPPSDSPFGGLPVDSLRIDQPIPSFGGVNPQPPWGKGTRGTANLKLLVAALEDVCAGAAGTNSTTSADDDGSATQDGPPPVISITPVDELPSGSTRYADPGQSTPYNEYTIHSRYRRDSGIIKAPMSTGGSQSGHTDPLTGGWVSDGPTAVYFRVAQPTSILEVTWTTEFVGSDGQVPDPDNKDANLVLLDHEITPTGPQVLPDGSNLVFRVSGRYLYGLKKAFGLNDQLAMPIVPWVAANFLDYYVGGYTQGIIGDEDGDSVTYNPNGGSGTTGPDA